jgi:cyclopropane fatty-acyl-phospholipid synthase-like methyltransferase
LLGLSGTDEGAYMSDFWENAFREKQMMWGENPSIAAIETAELFKENGFQKILIPGLGYGRNAKVFLEAGFEVTGIEISETAIAIGRRLFGSELRIVHGSVVAMPFDDEKYDGIFCHALIHLLDTKERKKLIADCFSQLKESGMMIFTVITKNAGSYGIGTQLGNDRFRTKDGVDLFFYDESSIREEFGKFGLKVS